MSNINEKFFRVLLISTLFLFCAHCGYTADKSLVAYWSFDEISGDVVKDISGNGHDATVKGATYEKAGIGHCLSFDGSSNEVVVPGFSDLPTTEITVLVWQKADNSKMQSTFSVSPDDGLDRINAHIPWGGGTVFWDFGNIDTDGRLSYVPADSITGEWQHFAFVASQSGDYMKIYRNGVEEASKPGMSPYSGTEKDFCIGSLAGGLFFGGMIDEVKIYKRALTEKEIEAEYRSGMKVLQ